MSFYVGQKVVCVNADPRAFNPVSCDWKPGEELVEGAIYTIRRAYVFNSLAIVQLDEICRAQIAFDVYGENAGYAAARFRPVVKRKTDISVFVAMLNQKHAPELEPETV